MTCPNSDQCAAVVTVVRPVTHSAEADVKSAVSGDVISRDCVEIGSKSKIVPSRNAAKYAAKINMVGLRKIPR